MNLPKRLFDFPYYQLEHFPLETMVTSRVNGQWKAYSTRSFVDHMNWVSAGLLACGVRPGDRIALITDANRSEWNIFDHAILQIGAIDVPIYPTMTEQDYEYIFNHAGARMCIVSNADLYEKVKRVLPKTPDVKDVFTFDQVNGARNWQELVELGKKGDAAEVIALSAQVKEEDLATIIYTSGTTGLPKGVMLSHRNIASNANDSTERLPEVSMGNSRSLSFLPCCHIFERMLHYLYMLNGVSIYLTGMEQIKDDMIYTRPHIFTAVPRLLEKFYDGIMAKGMANTGIKKTLFQWAVNLALKWEPDGANGAWYEFQLSLARKLVFSKVKAALGLTELGGAASGSAALQPRLARFFNGAGIPVLEGYGLTETSPVISVNTFRQPGMCRVGAVGKMIRNVEVRIAEDGEILCKGPNVMMGYYKAPELTAEVIRDGWFHTGDIGEVRDGFLAITDRKKEMFKTSGGKYVAPQVIENVLKESPFIEQCMVIGEGQAFPAALIVPEFIGLRDWAQRQGLGEMADHDLIKNQKVNAMISEEIEKRNSRFGKWEQIKAFRLLPAAFTIEAGEITPTLKLKRKKIMENNRQLVSSIYTDS
jgi:long-chain acyl-CoA synthetase